MNRRRKLFLVLLVLLGVGGGMFFIRGTPEVPLGLKIIKIAPVSLGGFMVTCEVTNGTGQSQIFRTEYQIFSNAGWQPAALYRPISPPTWTLKSHASITVHPAIIPTNGVIRAVIHYGRVRTPREQRIDDWLKKVHLSRVFGDHLRKEVITTPTNLPDWYKPPAPNNWFSRQPTNSPSR